MHFIEHLIECPNKIIVYSNMLRIQSGFLVSNRLLHLHSLHLLSSLNESGIPKKKGMACNKESTTSAMTLIDHPWLKSMELITGFSSNSCSIKLSDDNERRKYNFWRNE